MFHVLLLYPNIFKESVFLLTVNSVALKFQRIDQNTVKPAYAAY